jgi:hypothetical protein
LVGGRFQNGQKDGGASLRTRKMRPPCGGAISLFYRLTHHGKVLGLVGEDIDFSGGEFFSLLEREGEDAVKVGGFDVVGIEVLVEVDVELEAEGFLVVVLEFAFEGFALATDTEEAFFEADPDVLFGEAGEGNGEVKTCVVGAGFEAGSFGGDLSIHFILG